MKKIYFISGFPRAGNTVLTSILNQNPKIKATAHSILPDVIKQLDDIKKLNIYKNFPDEKSFDNLIQKTFTNYYDQWDADYIIERGDWITPYNLKLLQKYFKNNKIKIILVRDILQIIKSYVKLCKDNPEFYINQQYNLLDHTTLFTDEIETKVDLIMAKDKYINTMLYSIHQLKKNNLLKNFLLVDYNDLVDKPEITMNKIYNYYEIEPFKNSFKNLKAPIYNDSIMGAPMHKLMEGKIERKDYSIELSENIINKYKHLNKIFTNNGGND